MSRNNKIEIDVELVQETDVAFLFNHEWSDEPVWLSKLLCEFDQSCSVVTLRENIAIENGMV